MTLSVAAAFQDFAHRLKTKWKRGLNTAYYVLLSQATFWSRISESFANIFRNIRSFVASTIFFDINLIKRKAQLCVTLIIN